MWKTLHKFHTHLCITLVLVLYRFDIGPVSRVLRICWIRTNFEIHEHSKLYKLSPIQKHQIYPCHKNGHGQPRVIIWTTPQGMGIQPLGTSSGSILRLLLFPSFCISSRKILFASLFYMVFCFISYICTVYLALGQDETILGDNFDDGSRKVLLRWSLIACFKKIAMPSDFMHTFSWFSTCTCI